MHRWHHPGPIGLAVSVGAPAVICAVSVPLRGRVDNTNVALAVATVIVVMALRGGGLVTGALAAVSGAAAFDLLQTKPYGSLRIAGTRDSITTLLLLAVGLISGWLEERRREVQRREIEFARLQRVARLSAEGEEPEDLIVVVEAELTDLLGLKGCRFEAMPFETTLPRLEAGKLVIQQEQSAPDWGPRWELELPVRARHHQLGRFVLELPSGAYAFGIPRAHRDVAAALANQLGALLAVSWAAPPAASAPGQGSAR